MIHGPVTVPERHRVADGACDVLGCPSDSVRQAAPAGELRGNRGGERAAGAVRARRVDALALDLGEVAPVEQQVDEVCALEVSALDDYGGRAATDNAARLSGLVVGAHWHARKHLGFVAIRRDHRTEGQQPAAHRDDRVFVEELSPLLATITGSMTTCGRRQRAIAAATASTIAAVASMPVFTPSRRMSDATASICAATIEGGRT